jgi:hypothetical protein
MPALQRHLAVQAINRELPAQKHGGGEAEKDGNFHD